jgi:Zn-dependent protease
MFAHEMGHYVAARQCGLNVGAPAFIPFVGAWINLKEQPRDVRTEAYVAAAGPLVGTVAAVAVYLWGRWTDSPLLLAIAYAGSSQARVWRPLSGIDGLSRRDDVRGA